MSRDRRYARIYYDDLEREFPEVWRDATLRGDYVLLLAIAERAWPASPEVPRLAKPRSVKKLAQVGLILLEDPFNYRCRGMDKDREARRQHAAEAARKRYADRDAPGTAPSTASASRRELPSQAEPNQEKPSQADASERDIVDDYYRLTNRFPNATVKEWLERLANEFGHDAATRKLAAEFVKNSSSRTLLGRVENELKSDRHEAGKRAAAAEKDALERWAKEHQLTPEQAAENKRRLDEIRREWFGKEEAA